MTKATPIQPGLFEELIVDNFAGGGGASLGIERGLGRAVDIAINHDREAVEMHEKNHPYTTHYIEDVWVVDPVAACKGRPVGLAWFSPDCKHFSKAKGGKPVSRDIRGLAWVTVKWARKVRPRVIMLENVEEFKTWGPLRFRRDNKGQRIEDTPEEYSVAEKPLYGEFEAFGLYSGFADEAVRPLRNKRYQMEPHPDRKGETFKLFVHRLKQLGYKVDWKEIRACDYGAPTIRKRLFMVARCDGMPIVWPSATHGLGKKKYRTAADCIDWSIPCPSIFERKKPLAENTQRRIAKGIFKFVINTPNPFFITYYGPKNIHDFRGFELSDQIPTQTTENRFGLVTPFIAPIANYNGSVIAHDADKPLRTITAWPKGGSFALVSAFLAKNYGGNYAGAGIHPDKQMATVTTKDHHSLVTSHLIKMYSSCNHGQDVRKPMPTVTATGQHIGEVRAFLTKYYGTACGQSLKNPAATVTSKDRFGLVTVAGLDYQIVDIGMRMLAPRELYRAQGFGDDYQIDFISQYTGKPLTKTAQVRMCGNSVSPHPAEALVRANVRIQSGVKVAA